MKLPFNQPSTTLLIEAILTLFFSAATILLLIRCWPTVSPPDLPSVPRLSHADAVAIPAPAPAPSLAYEALPALGHEFDKDDSLPTHAIPIADYTLNVTLDTNANVVKGTGVIRWRNRSTQPVEHLYIHLYANAFRSTKTNFLSDRRPGWIGSGLLYEPGHIEVKRFALRQQEGDDRWPHARRTDDRNLNDETNMLVPLLRPIEPGGEVDIEVEWETKLPYIVARMGYAGSFHMVAQWFPKIAKHEPDGSFSHFSYDRLGEFYADFGTYDVTLSVPKEFVVGATGSRISESLEGDRKVLRHVQENVHDFAFAAWDGFREIRRDIDGVTIHILFPSGLERMAREQMDAAVFGLRHFGRLYGAYPHSTLTIVHPPPEANGAGGMEYPTLITTGGRWWRRGPIGSARRLTLHELGHQYFHSLVATNEHAWPFLDEGLTTFAEVDALDEGWGHGSALALRDWGISASTGLRFLGLMGAQDDIIAQSAPEFSSGHTYGRLVYGRAGLVLATLDRIYPGKLRQALGRYARRYRYAHPEPDHLVATVRDTVGETAAEFLRTCLFDRGWIDLAIQDIACFENRCTLVVTRRGNLVVPVDVLWIHADGSESTSTWDGKSFQTTLTLRTESPVMGAILDPDHKILLDEDFANNGIRRGVQPRSWRTQGVLNFVAALGLFAVSP